MRKIFALLAVAFGVMSCQTDVNDFGANVGGEQDVNILVSLPDATRASENGAFGNVDFAQYDIEYFFQVFDATNDDNWKAMQTKVCDDKEVSFPVRLIAGRDYRFVVWAHLVDAAGNAHYTVGETLKDITLNKNSNWVAMDDTRDAYTGVKTATFTGASDIAIELTRPFAKLRVVTTDMEEQAGDFEEIFLRELASYGIAAPRYCFLSARTAELLKGRKFNDTLNRFCDAGVGLSGREKEELCGLIHELVRDRRELYQYSSASQEEKYKIADEVRVLTAANPKDPDSMYALAYLHSGVPAMEYILHKQLNAEVWTEEN